MSMDAGIRALDESVRLIRDAWQEMRAEVHQLREDNKRLAQEIRYLTIDVEQEDARKQDPRNEETILRDQMQSLEEQLKRVDLSQRYAITNLNQRCDRIYKALVEGLDSLQNQIHEIRAGEL